MRASRRLIGIAQNGATITVTRLVVSGTPIAGMKSGASGTMIGAGITTVLGRNL